MKQEKDINHRNPSFTAPTVTSPGGIQWTLKDNKYIREVVPVSSSDPSSSSQPSFSTRPSSSSKSQSFSNSDSKTSAPSISTTPGYELISIIISVNTIVLIKRRNKFKRK